MKKIDVLISDQEVQFDPPVGLSVRPSAFLASGTCAKIPKDKPRVILVALDVWTELLAQLEKENG